jgi:flotillin
MPEFFFLLLVAGVAVLVFSTIILFASRYKRCPSDKILVVYGKVGKGQSARCIHGGATFILPIVQDYRFLDLTPMPIDIKLTGALSKQNIRVNTPSTFTVGIATKPGVMENAAERLLGLPPESIRELAKDIIFGQMRVVLATMSIEEINCDRDKLIENISRGVEVELEKVGLRLINVNIQDITDESGYIAALGQEAAARAINDAKIKVAQAERDGEIGSAQAQKEQKIMVSQAHAEATQGENLAAVDIANSNANRLVKEAEADRLAEAAQRVAAAKVEQETLHAQREAEVARAERDKAAQYAGVVVPAEIEKQRIETIAAAEAAKQQIEAKGKGDAIRLVQQAQADGQKAQFLAEAEGQRAKLLAEAEGTEKVLMSKAAGFRALVEVTSSNPDLAINLLLTEQLPRIVEEQVKALANIKVDKITVWDSGAGADGKNSTASFLSGLAGSLPPIHELARNAGIELPQVLGRTRHADGSSREPSSEVPSSPPPGKAK